MSFTQASVTVPRVHRSDKDALQGPNAGISVSPRVPESITAMQSGTRRTAGHLSCQQKRGEIVGDAWAEHLSRQQRRGETATDTQAGHLKVSPLCALSAP